MVFSSVPPYLDHQNWHHQLHQSNIQQGNGGENHQQILLPPPPLPLPPPSSGGGGGSEGSIRPGSMVDKARLAKIPLPEPGLNCPRCDSTNTKFCYFNNYSLTQPRHFCKTCRRYWTRGGALRNVPVGGGCRRNKRSKSRGSKSPAPKSANASPSRGSTEMSTSQLSQPNLPSLQLPFMGSALQNLTSQYGFGLNNMSSNIGTFQAQDMGFQRGSMSAAAGNNFNNILSPENWKLPFMGGFDIPNNNNNNNNNNLFQYQTEGIVEATSSSVVGGDQLRSSGMSTQVVVPPVKLEEANRSMNLSRQFLGIPQSSNAQQHWVNNNSWVEFSGLNSSSPTANFL